MSKLAAVKAGHQQLTIDEYLALDRDETPLEAPREGRKEPSTITAGMDIDLIRADLEALGDVSQVKKGTVSHNGLCPFRQECYNVLGLVTQHCAYNLDRPPTWRWCGGYKRRKRR